MKFLFVMRGIPGSGKTTIATVLAGGLFTVRRFVGSREYAVCSADNYKDYYDENGKYVWTPEKCEKAHKYCKELFLDAIKEEKHIIIDNTNITPKNWEYYTKIGKENGYTVIFVSIPPEESKLEEYANRNKHGVPIETIKQMHKNWR